MKTMIFAGALSLLPIAAIADGFVMGSGRWSCGDVVRVAESGSGIEQGQVAGWIMGFWTAVTFEREDDFVNIVENAGAEAIYNATVTECRKALEAPLFRVVQSMISNTK